MTPPEAGRPTSNTFPPARPLRTDPRHLVEAQFGRRELLACSELESVNELHADRARSPTIPRRPGKIGGATACSPNMTTPETITVYWRPGCGFCSNLLRRLDARGIPHERVNIWDNPAAASRVRAIAGGNETVPTVTVGDRSLVNPRINDVMRLIDPGPDTSDRRPDGAPPGGRRTQRRWLRAFATLGWCSSLVPDPDDAQRRAKMGT